MAPRARTVDLHTHSAASDGALAPAELVARAAGLGLAALALTDHDTVGGLGEALAAGRRLGVEVVAGIELAAEIGGGEIHILGLGIDPERSPPVYARLRRRRAERARRMVARLAEIGVAAPGEMTAELFPPPAAGGTMDGDGDGGPSIGRPHVAAALVRAGAVKSMAEAFSRYLYDGGPADIPKERLAAEEAIGLVHGQGGLAILAHPGLAGAERYLEELAGLGLDGVEAYHSKHSAETTARLLRWAGSRGLAVSGGSDFHQPGAGVELGKPAVPAEVLDRLRAAGG